MSLNIHTLTVGVLVAACCLAGCMPFSSRSGTDLNKFEQFTVEKNVTTEKELIEHFGEPATTSMQGDGSKLVVWHGGQVKSHVNFAEAIVPLVGFADKDRTAAKTQSLTATIRNGVVVDYSLTNSSQRF